MVFTKVFFRIMGKDFDSSEMTALLLMHLVLHHDESEG